MTRFGAVQAERLQLLLLGPGYGESIIVGIPGEPPGWMVVDSLLVGRATHLRQPVREALKALGVVPDLVLLTHAHADHAGGMDRLIEWLPPTSRVATVITDFRSAASGKLRDAAQRVEARAALRAIEQLPRARRWGQDLAPESLGAGTVTLLHPDAAAARRLLADASAHPNLLSTPVRIDWAGRSILLGADLEGGEWQNLAGGGTLATHDPAKVPHHGSPGAFDTLWAGAPPTAPTTRTFVVTPFKRRPKLPDLDHPNAIPALVLRAQRVYTTSLPFRTSPPVAGEIELTTLRAARDAAAAGRRPLPSRLGNPTPPESPDQTDDGWVRVEVDSAGHCGVVRGAACVAITA